MRCSRPTRRAGFSLTRPRRILPSMGIGRRALHVACASAVALAAVLALRAWRQSAQSKAAALALEEERAREEARAATRRACRLPEGAPLRETVSIQGACQAAVVQAWRSPAGTAA